MRDFIREYLPYVTGLIGYTIGLLVAEFIHWIRLKTR